MSRFISLSSIRRILVTAKSSASVQRDLFFSGMLNRRIPGIHVRVGWNDNGWASAVFLQYQCETFAVDGLDHVIGCSQIKAHDLVVHDGGHDDRYVRELRFRLQLTQYPPAVQSRHHNVERDDSGTNFLRETKAFF